MHSFVENVRQWGTGTARRIDPVPLDTLLLNYGLKCYVPEGVTPPPNTQDVQLVVGGVGTGTGDNKKAIACNYLGDGSLKQNSCARYTDGGLRAAGKSHPLGINAMMRKHFGMTCEWVA